MHKESVLKKEIDLNNTNKYRLSIQLGLNGFSFSIKDRFGYHVLEYQQYEDIRANGIEKEFEQFIEKNEILKNEYQSVSIIIDSPKYTLVPRDKFEADSILESFNLLHDIKETECLNYINHLDVVVVYTCEKLLKRIISKYYPEAHIIPSLISILYYAEYTQEIEYQVLIHKTSETQVEILLHHNKELLLCNSYTCTSNTDIIYYTLNAIKSFGIEFDKCRLIYSGEFSELEVLKPLLDYLSSVQPIRIIQPIRNIDRETAQKHLVNLLNTDLCE